MDGSWDMGDDVCICLRTSFFSGFLTFSMMLEGCTFPPPLRPPSPPQPHTQAAWHQDIEHSTSQPLRFTVELLE